MRLPANACCVAADRPARDHGEGAASSPAVVSASALQTCCYMYCTPLTHAGTVLLHQALPGSPRGRKLAGKLNGAKTSGMVPGRLEECMTSLQQLARQAYALASMRCPPRACRLGASSICFEVLRLTTRKPARLSWRAGRCLHCAPDIQARCDW